MLNSVEWASFNFCDVFIFTRGKRLISLNHIAGEIPYISSSKINNGIDNYIHPPEYMAVHENALTLNNSGSVGYCFYHPYKFVASDHCTVIKIRDSKIELNVYIALFLKPIIEAMKYKYNFAREISNARLSKENIILPIDNERRPNWQFMEHYMKELSKTITYSSPVIKQATIKNIMPNSNTKWREFNTTSFFDISSSRSEYKRAEIFPGEYFYITTSNKNNGIASTSGIYTESGNVITIDCATDGMAFYQEYKFTTSAAVVILTPKFPLNKYIGLFITTILNLQLDRYSYGRKRSQKRICAEKLYLPINSEYQPDWQLMENYIKSLPYSSNL